MNTNNTHSKYKSQLSIQLPSSSIEDFKTTTRYLFQGKLIDLELNKAKTILSLHVTMPLGVNKWPVGAGELFKQVRIDVSFQTLLLGLMDNDTLEVKLEDNEKILTAFKNRVFRGDFGSPEQHGVDDQDIPLMVNVHFRKNHYDLPWEVLEFVLPTMDKEMPFIKAVVRSMNIYDSDGEKLNKSEIENRMKPFYEDDFVNEKDRLKIEWQELHGIKNSFDFYNNRLQNWYWFQYQFQPQREEKPIIKESLGDILRPVWVDCINIKKEDHGYVEHLTIYGVIKSKKEALMYESSGELWWIAPEGYGETLTFLSTELVNSQADNPFQEVLDLYISRWEPNDTVDKCLPFDLERVVEADRVLSNHPFKKKFFKLLNKYADERCLVWV